MKNSAGVTLLELIVVIAIVGILAAIAVPSYVGVTTTNRIATEVNSFVSDLQFARSEAIKKGQSVTICSSTDGSTCSASVNWHTGWIVFSDDVGNGDRAAAEVLSRVRQTFIVGTVNDTFIASGSTKAIKFNREGFATLSATTTFTLHNSSNQADKTRCVEVSSVGRVTLRKEGQGACL